MEGMKDIKWLMAVECGSKQGLSMWVVECKAYISF
jgi:hypothetical protein